MTPKELTELIEGWKKYLWFKNNKIEYIENILEDAIYEFRFDYLRWFPNHTNIEFEYLERTPQLISVLCYRLSNLYHRLNIGDESKDIISLIGRTIGQTEIYYSSQIGRGMKINHGIGTVIGARVKIGSNCLIHHNVTLGDRGGGRPTIGDNVTIYAGAIILGDIYIGNNTIIAANAVVLNSSKDNSVLIGMPAVNKQL